MGFWSRLFGKSDSPWPEPEPVGPPPADIEAFCRLIAREGAWLVAKEIKGDEIKFIDYKDEQGRHVWPLFSSQETAAMWVNGSGVKEITPFPCLQLTPSGVVETAPAQVVVVFDARSPHEREMSGGDMAKLRALVAEGEAR
jgi:hypothetical protein